MMVLFSFVPTQLYSLFPCLVFREHYTAPARTPRDRPHSPPPAPRARAERVPPHYRRARPAHSGRLERDGCRLRREASPTVTGYCCRRHLNGAVRTDSPLSFALQGQTPWSFREGHVLGSTPGHGREAHLTCSTSSASRR